MQTDFTEAACQFSTVKVRIDTCHGSRTPSLSVATDSEQLSLKRQAFGQKLVELMQLANITGRQLSQSVGVSPSLVTQWRQGICAPEQTAFALLCAALNVAAEQLAPQGLETIRWTGKNPVSAWLEELCLWGCSAHNKVIPSLIFTLPKAQLALFLNRLFATDGWASVLASGQAQIGYASVCEKLARQIQHLLLRFGIISTLKQRQVKYENTRRSAWQLDITDAIALKTFASEIGIFSKEAAVNQVVEAVKAKKYHTNKDLIPVEIWDDLHVAKGTESWVGLAKRAGLTGTSNIHVGKRALSRSRLSALATAVDHQPLQDMATQRSVLGRNRLYRIHRPSASL